MYRRDSTLMAESPRTKMNPRRGLVKVVYDGRWKSINGTEGIFSVVRWTRWDDKENAARNNPRLLVLGKNFPPHLVVVRQTKTKQPPRKRGNPHPFPYQKWGIALLIKT
jgi:hypothetical protein